MKNKIKELREAQRMTQDELASKSGVSRGTICALENNDCKDNVTTKTLGKLAKALGTTLKDIFFD